VRPSPFFRNLCEFTRYRSKLVSCKSSEKNRFQNALTVCNVALDAVALSKLWRCLVDDIAEDTLAGLLALAAADAATNVLVANSLLSPFLQNILPLRDHSES